MTSDHDRYDFREFFIECFSRMKDPGHTSKGNLKYRLDERLFIVLSAVVIGATDRTAISDFCHCQGEWPKKYFSYANGTSSHDVLGRLFGEDRPQKRTGNSSHNFNLVPKIALGIPEPGSGLSNVQGKR